MDDETDGQHDTKYYVVAIHHDTEEACVLAHTNYKETIICMKQQNVPKHN